MKKISALLCILFLLLSGCAMGQERLDDPVSFYFFQKEYRFENQRTMIVSEQRDAAGHRKDLSYMLALYLMGPVSENCVSPVPSGTRIYVKDQQNGKITLELSEAARTMTDAQFSLACSCLTLTCLDITGAKEVTVVNGDRVISMTQNTLTLFDSPAQISTTEATQ